MDDLLPSQSLAIDVYLSNFPFPDAMPRRTRFVDFAGATIPVLSEEELIACKAALDSPEDWIDIDNVFQVQQDRLDTSCILRWQIELYEEDDERIERINLFRQDSTSRPEQIDG